MSNDERERKHRREELIALLLVFWASLGPLTKAAAEGEIMPQAFGALFTGHLETLHTRAAFVGRQMADPVSAEHGITETDRLFGHSVAAGEAAYIQGFMDDMEAGKYADDPSAVLRRARLYAFKAVGTANRAWIATEGSGGRYHWRTDESAHHCRESPRIAAKGPYAAESLPTVPGNCETPCLFNCRCWLEDDEGNIVGFDPRDVPEPPELDAELEEAA